MIGTMTGTRTRVARSRTFALAAILMLALSTGVRLAAAADIETAVVETNGSGETYVADGYVEAVRQSVIAAQVSGRVTALAVKAGDAIKNGQILVRIDERAATQQAAASDASSWACAAATCASLAAATMLGVQA